VRVSLGDSLATIFFLKEKHKKANAKKVQKRGKINFFFFALHFYYTILSIKNFKKEFNRR